MQGIFYNNDCYEMLTVNASSDWVLCVFLCCSVVWRVLCRCCFECLSKRRSWFYLSLMHIFRDLVFSVRSMWVHGIYELFIVCSFSWCRAGICVLKLDFTEYSVHIDSDISCQRISFQHNSQFSFLPTYCPALYVPCAIMREYLMDSVHWWAAFFWYLVYTLHLHCW